MLGSAPDDQRLHIIRRDLSGGVNTRQHGRNIGENQSSVLYNADLSVPGETKKRLGITLVEDLGNDAGIGLFGFNPDGGSSVLVAMHGQKLETYTGSGTFTEQKTDFTTNLLPGIFKGAESGEGDVFFVGNGTDNWFRFEPDDYSTPQDLGNTAATGSDSPPASKVGLFFRNRLWVIKSNQLYYSAAFPADYSSAFDTQAAGDYFYLPIGTERALIGIRDSGIVAIGSDSIWAINPSATPDAADLPEPLLDIGCVANNTVCHVGDDIYFLAPDGVRGLFRTVQDKIQLGQSFPLSYILKDEYDNINWAYISKACAVFYDNRYLISIPTGSSTYNNQVWEYYPSTKSWIVHTGLNIAAFAKVTFSGQEKLYAIDSNDGKVYQFFYGYDDNGTAINFQEESRKEDFGQPHVKKRGMELKVILEATGDYDVTVYAQFDDGGWNELGDINLSGNAVTFPLTFPVAFNPITIAYEKFHIDSYGSWYHMQWKIQHNAANGTDDIKILERSVSAIIDDIDTDEEV